MKLSGLARARKARNLTQAELAEKMGVQRETIARYEIGERDPSSEMLLKLASTLGVTPNDLLLNDPAQPATAEGEEQPRAEEQPR